MPHGERREVHAAALLEVRCQRLGDFGGSVLPDPSCAGGADPRPTNHYPGHVRLPSLATTRGVRRWRTARSISALVDLLARTRSLSASPARRALCSASTCSGAEVPVYPRRPLRSRPRSSAGGAVAGRGLRYACRGHGASVDQQVEVVDGGDETDVGGLSRMTITELHGSQARRRTRPSSS